MPKEEPGGWDPRIRCSRESTQLSLGWSPAGPGRPRTPTTPTTRTTPEEVVVRRYTPIQHQASAGTVGGPTARKLFFLVGWPKASGPPVEARAVKGKTAPRRAGDRQRARPHPTATTHYTTTVHVTQYYVRTYWVDTFVTLCYAAAAGWWL